MMPLRYLALAAHGESSLDERLPGSAELTRMTVTYRAGPIALMTNKPGDMLVLPAAQGFVIGKLFHRHGYPEQISALSPEAVAKIVASRGQHLIERYWGSYVAVLSETESGVLIMRDPSSGLPCYSARFDGGIAFASDAPILVEAGMCRSSVDWEIVGRTLYRHQLPPERTAIGGISQILGGCGLALRGGAQRPTRHWSPWDHIAPIVGREQETSAERLERVICMTMRAWSACFSKPVVGMSGGLDSSIVAASLARAGAALGCVTLTTDDPRGDERRYAREVCDLIGAPLIALPFSENAIDFDVSVAAGVPIPCGKLHEQSYNAAVREAVGQFGGDAFFVGAGGDNVFYATHSARPLLDLYDAHGFSRRTWSTLRDIARLTGASLWQVMREARRLSRVREARISWNLVPDYLDGEFVQAQASQPIEHPWLDAKSAVPLGKLGQVKLLLGAQNHLEHRDKGLPAPMISPLLSQPVVETCLAIPTWEAIEGGVDRSVARRAFCSSLPSAITARGGKGSPESFVARFIEGHRDTIAERLLDGKLAEHGLIDRAALEMTLRNQGKLGPRDCGRLMILLDTEAWVRHWTG